jgi:hypothetical protein
MIFIFWTIVVNRGDGGFAGPPQVAPEQLMYLNPGIAMLDVVANAEPGGGGAISSALAQLRGDRFNLDQPLQCDGDICGPVDDSGNVIDEAANRETPGYWWPRVAITFLLLSAALTVASMRLVVPAGMRWAFAQPGRHATSGPEGHASDPASDGVIAEEISGETRP